METKNIFPEINIFPVLDRIARLGKFVTDRFYSDVPATGAAAMLDEQLYDTQYEQLRLGE